MQKRWVIEGVALASGFALGVFMHAPADVAKVLWEGSQRSRSGPLGVTAGIGLLLVMLATVMETRLTGPRWSWRFLGMAGAGWMAAAGLWWHPAWWIGVLPLSGASMWAYLQAPEPTATT